MSARRYSPSASSPLPQFEPAADPAASDSTTRVVDILPAPDSFSAAFDELPAEAAATGGASLDAMFLHTFLPRRSQCLFRSTGAVAGSIVSGMALAELGALPRVLQALGKPRDGVTFVTLAWDEQRCNRSRYFNDGLQSRDFCVRRVIRGGRHPVFEAGDPSGNVWCIKLTDSVEMSILDNTFGVPGLVPVEKISVIMDTWAEHLPEFAVVMPMLLPFNDPSVRMALKTREIVNNLAVSASKILLALHDRGFVHRDVSPDNFLFARNETHWTIYLADLSSAVFNMDRLSKRALTFAGAKLFASDILLRPDHRGAPYRHAFDWESLLYTFAHFQGAHWCSLEHRPSLRTLAADYETCGWIFDHFLRGAE